MRNFTQTRVTIASNKMKIDQISIMLRTVVQLEESIATAASELFSYLKIQLAPKNIRSNLLVLRNSPLSSNPVKGTNLDKI